MKYDVAVIGGGPAGIMAAGRAGELGARVLLVEKNPNLGVKLLITGKGRCNITNNTDELKDMINRYGENGKFLFSSFHGFGVGAIVDFFESRGVETKVERGNRIFPVSDKSQDVLDALIGYMKESGVEIKTGSAVKEIVKVGDSIEKIVLIGGREVKARKYVVCTGGKSYPGTGSTGDGYEWLKKLGHNVINPSPALSPIMVKEKITERIEGLSLKNVEISVFKDGKKQDSRFGEALFTEDGMSGPIILDMSKKINRELPGNVQLKIDFKPALDFVSLDKRIQKDFQEGNNKMFKNILDKLLPQKLIGVIIELSKIDSDKKVNLITREERKRLLHLLKEFTLNVKGLTGYSKAVVTAGGVDLSEVDPRTMKSKLIDNLYFAGEILDIDGPTGGYNLQVCWSTGFAAGEGVV